MAWIKRNLGLVIAGVVSIALLAVAIMFLLSKKTGADEATAKLDEQTAKLKELGGRNPGLSVENINAAKEDQKKIEDFLKELKQHFVTPSYPTQLTSREFGVLLDDKVSGLKRSAQRSGVEVDKAYKFSFAVQATSVKTPQSAYQQLAIQLVEIESICQALIDAKVNSIKRVRRAAVTTEEIAGSDDFVDAKGATNEWTIVSPYEVAFTGFSGDLGHVFEALIKSKNCITVKNVVSEQASSASSDTTTGATPGSETPASSQASMMARYGMRPGMSPALASRYGLGGRPRPEAPAAAPQPPPQTGPRTLQDEKLLKFTLTLETVRLNASGKAVKAAPAAPAADAAAAPTTGAEPAAEQ